MWSLACTGPDAPAEALSHASPEEDAVQAERRALLTSLKAFVQERVAAGAYDCCVKTPCNHCALYTGHCACGPGVRKGDPVCDDCAYQWERGLGDEPVDASTVRSFTEEQRRRSGKLCAPPALAPAEASPVTD